MTILTRLRDKVVIDLDDLEATYLVSPKGLYDITRNREYSGGAYGEQVPVSSSIAAKVFTLNFVSDDTSGESLLLLQRFFSEEGWYRIEDDEMLIDSTDFTVKDVDSDFYSGSANISVTCNSKYGDLMDENRTVLFEQTYTNGGYFDGWAGRFINTDKVPAELVLSITSDRDSVWTPYTQITISRESGESVTAYVGKTWNDGSLQAWNGYEFVLNSYKEIQEGEGIILPMVSTFFKIQAGESVSVSVSAFPIPIVGYSDEVTVRFEGITVTPKKYEVRA